MRTKVTIVETLSVSLFIHIYMYVYNLYIYIYIHIYIYIFENPGEKTVPHMYIYINIVHVGRHRIPAFVFISLPTWGGVASPFPLGGFQVPQVERHRWLSEAVSCAGGTQWKRVERRRRSGEPTIIS